MGIEITLKLLKQNNDLEIWQNKFNISKKKDDLVDSYLQGVWYLINKTCKYTCN